MLDPPDEGYVPEVLLEDRKVRYLRLMVDLSLSMIRQRQVERKGAENLARDARRLACALFPDGGHLFDMIYGPRFERAIGEAYPEPGGPTGEGRR